MSTSNTTPRASLALVLPSFVVALGLGWLLRGACAPLEGPGVPGDAPVSGAEADPATVWTCSMHPQVRETEPVLCPICAMELVPVEEDTAAEDPVLTLSPATRARMTLETAAVVRQDASMDVRMSGKLALDETRISTITAWVGGRLDRLFVDATGVDVTEGDHLVEIYSPELYGAQAELLQVLGRAQGDALSSSLVDAARERLRQFGLTERQVVEVEERGTATDTYTLYAPDSGVVVHRGASEGQWVERGTSIFTIADLSHVWVELDAYERDLPWLRYGQDVTFETEAFPGEVFQGTIALLAPQLDERTRTVTVRVNVENHDRRLRPGMFVRAVVHADVGARGQVLDPALAGKWTCTMHPEVIVEQPEDCPVCEMDLVPAESRGAVATPTATEPPLLVPATAPLLTGRRAVVYVEREVDEAGHTYEGREVVLGPRVGPWFVVLAGLEEGERVVVEGAFKLDAELQIRAKPSMMSLAGGDRDAGAAAAPPPAEPPLERVDVPGVRLALAPVWEAYRALGAALAGDDLEAARAAAALLAEAGAAVDAAAFPAAELLPRLLGLELAAEPGAGGPAAGDGLVPLANALAGSPDVEAARADFAGVSARMTELVRRYGVEDATVRLMECPMAFDGDGGRWLQADAVLANPYFGASMLRCGDELELLQDGGER